MGTPVTRISEDIPIGSSILQGTFLTIYLPTLGSIKKVSWDEDVSRKEVDKYKKTC